MIENSVMLHALFGGPDSRKERKVESLPTCIAHDKNTPSTRRIGHGSAVFISEYITGDWDNVGLGWLRKESEAVAIPRSCAYIPKLAHILWSAADVCATFCQRIQGSFYHAMIGITAI
jgi:hypothetical protein